MVIINPFCKRKNRGYGKHHTLDLAAVSSILGEELKKMLVEFMSESVLPMFSSRSFIESGLTFRFLIHFELIFCLWC